MKRKRRHRRMRPASVGQTMNPKLSLDERDAESLLLLGQVERKAKLLTLIVMTLYYLGSL